MEYVECSCGESLARGTDLWNDWISSINFFRLYHQNKSKPCGSTWLRFKDAPIESIQPVKSSDNVTYMTDGVALDTIKQFNARVTFGSTIIIEQLVDACKENCGGHHHSYEWRETGRGCSLGEAINNTIKNGHFKR